MITVQPTVSRAPAEDDRARPLAPPALQVADDRALLELMIRDMRNSPEIYRPTNYWAVYESRFLPLLRAQGLRDFRRRRNSILTSFGATDLPVRREINLARSKIFNNRFSRRIPLWINSIEAVSAWLNRALPFDPGLDPEAAARLAFEFVRAKGAERGARPLEQLDVSLYGNPEDTFRVNERVYTTSILFYYMEYAYCCQFIDFDRLALFAEVGSGSGKQVEVIKKLHPGIAFVLLDIPPQLYVCHQYLRAVFPQAVVPYHETRRLEVLRPEAGKIYLLGTWQLPLLERASIGLFWNAASFQEMEPDVVLNYLGVASRRAQRVFLQEAMAGMQVARRRGRLGVLTPTTLEHYRRGLSNFRLVHQAPSLTPFGPSSEYSDSFWDRTS